MRNAARVTFALTILLLLASCAWQMTLMPRDSGRTYSGVMTGDGMGSGTMTVTIEDIPYTGPAVRVGSNDTFGFSSAYATNNRGSSASAFGTSYAVGDRFVKAILSAPTGRGLRCDLVGRGRTGGGICVDDNGKIYDVVLVSQ